MTRFHKTQIILAASFLSAFSIIGTISLTSCSILVPFFNAPNEKTVQCATYAYVDVSASWRDYYFDDVNDPYKMGDIDFHGMGPSEEGGKGYISVVSSSKNKDPIKKEQTINIKFQCQKDLLQTDENFDVEILWSISHTSFKKTTVIHFVHPSMDMPIDFFLSSGSLPNDISRDVSFPRDPNAWLLTHNNTIDVVNDIYRSSQTNYLGQIYNNLFNDFFYWQHLMLQNMTHIVIDPSLGVYVDTDTASWTMDVKGIYNTTTGIFDFLSVSFNAFATYHSPGTKKANVHFDFCWGKDPNMKSEWFDIGDVKENIDGPELLGAYTLNTGLHVPQDAKSSPYNQNFLSLVPSTTHALQLFNLRINAANDSHQDQNILLASYYHSYFLQQPRMIGLEYQSGNDHLFDLDSMPLWLPPIFKYDRYCGFFDSFKNWGLVIPSYYLSGVNCDYNSESQSTTWTQEFSRPNIPPCELDLNSKIPTLINNIKNNDGTQTDQKGFSDNWLQSYENISADKLDYPTNDGIFTEWAKSYDKNSSLPINCQPFVTSKLNEQDINSSCIENWADITASASNVAKRNDLKWFQVIQQRAPSLRGHEMSTYSDGKDEHYDWPDCKDGQKHKVPKQNIIWGSGQFQSFCFGLNYMFTCSGNMVGGQDNLFEYSNPANITLTQP